MKKSKSENPEIEVLRERVLSFLSQNKGLVNINHVARMINDGKQINNFADMVNGTRRMPDEFVKPLFDVMAQFCLSGGDMMPVPEVQFTEQKVDESDEFIKFAFDNSGGHTVTGYGMEYTSSGKSVSTKINGEPVLDIMLNSRVNMAVGFVDSIKKQLKK